MKMAMWLGSQGFRILGPWEVIILFPNEVLRTERYIHVQYHISTVHTPLL